MKYPYWLIVWPPGTPPHNDECLYFVGLQECGCCSDARPERDLATKFPSLRKARRQRDRMTKAPYYVARGVIVRVTRKEKR